MKTLLTTNLPKKIVEEFGFLRDENKIRVYIRNIRDDFKKLLREKVEKFASLEHCIFLLDKGKSDYLWLQECFEPGENTPDKFIVSSIGLTDAVGHNQRKWEAERGNLHFNLVYKIGDLGEYFYLPSCMVLASICESLNDIGVNAKIKLLTDVVVGDKKIGGILSAKKGDYYIFGIGININTLPNVNDLNNNPFVKGVTSVNQELGEQIAPGNILKSIAERFEGKMKLLKNKEFQNIVSNFQGFNYLIGEEVLVLRDKPISQGKVYIGEVIVDNGIKLEGVIIGINQFGFPIIRTSKGEVSLCHSCRIVRKIDYLK